jgi:hypothetical protein
MLRSAIIMLGLSFLASTARAEPTEVVVRGRTREPASTTLSSEDVRTIPGAFGDPFRAVDALPGAISLESGTPYTIVRGAPPGNTAVLIDGIPVPLLFHLAIGPAVLPLELIDRVDYFAGGAPAQFGRAVGGVISAETRAPSTRRRAYGQARFFDAGALVESPLADGRAYALAAGRFSYTAAALSLFSPGIELGYSDYQTRAGVHLDDKSELSVLAFGSHDRRGAFGEFKTTYDADFHRADLRFDHAFAGGGRLRLATTLGLDASSNEQAGTRGRLARVRVELDRPVDEHTRLRAGVDTSYMHVDAGKPKKDDAALEFQTTLLYPEHTDVVTGAFLDVPWRPIPRVEIIPGVRADLYDWTVAKNWPDDARRDFLSTYVDHYNAPMEGRSSAFAIDPRLASRFGLTRDVAILATVGAYHQGPSFFAPSPGVHPAGFQRGLQSSFQRTAGVELALPAELSATGTLFSHEYRNTTAFTSCSIPQGGFDLKSPCIGTRTNGGSVGFELLLRRSLSERVGGFIAYTLSRAIDEPVETPSWRPTYRRKPTPFDHTHVLNVATSVRLGAGWVAGGRLFLYTGRPIDRRQRTEPFVRVDVRVEKRWPILRDGWMAVVAEGLNVTFAREETLDCSDACKSVYQAPVVIPSLGVEAHL